MGLVICMATGLTTEEVVLVGFPLSSSIGMLAGFLLRRLEAEGTEFGYANDKAGLNLEV